MTLKNRFFQTTIIILSLISVSISGFAQSKASYHIQNGVEINKADCNDLTQLIIMLPYAQTNQ